MEGQRVVVITGVSGTLGQGLARRFAEEGAMLVLASKRPCQIDELAGECRRQGGRAVSVRADLSLEDDVRHVASRAIDSFGRIDAWVNNTGLEGALGSIAGQSAQERVVCAGLLGTLFGSQQALTHFRRQGKGVLVNIAGTTGPISGASTAALSATKFGVVGLGTALRQEIRDVGMWDVHVCTVIPAAAEAAGPAHRLNGAPDFAEGQHTARVIDTVVDLVAHPRDEVVVSRRPGAAEPRTRVGAFETCPGRDAHTEDADLPAVLTHGVVREPDLTPRH